MQVRDWLAKHNGLRMGVNTVRRVLESEGWVPPYTKVERRSEKPQRFEAVRRNVLWHSDFKHAFINSAKVYILIFQDDYSRFIVGHAVCDGEKAEVVLASLQTAIGRHGKPEELMTDGGSAFHSWRGISQLTKFLEETGIDHYVARTPNVNGKVENLNQQLEKELLLTKSYASLEEFAGALVEWIEFYNFSRVHQGLGKLETPAERFFPGAREAYSQKSGGERGLKEGLLRLLLSA
jgi:transposase InsO family protein